MDIRKKHQLRLRTDEIIPGNQQTLERCGNRREYERVFPISERILRPCRHSNYLPRENRQNTGTPNTRLARRYHHRHTRNKNGAQQKIEFSSHQAEKRRLPSKQEKIKILPKRTKRLGHTISKDGIRPNKQQTDAINKSKLDSPNTKLLKSFLGAIQYLIIM